MINPWPGIFVTAAGLVVLLGWIWLLRGERAVLLACVMTGVSVVLLGTAAGSTVTVAGGAVIIAIALPIWLRTARRIR